MNISQTEIEQNRNYIEEKINKTEKCVKKFNVAPVQSNPMRFSDFQAFSWGVFGFFKFIFGFLTNKISRFSKQFF
jgi:hypothetical protein